LSQLDFEPHLEGDLELLHLAILDPACFPNHLEPFELPMTFDASETAAFTASAKLTLEAPTNSTIYKCRSCKFLP
jgi:hypothetical protein